MKLLTPNLRQGNTLMVTLIMTLTIGMVLASYLGLIGSRYKVTVRSQCWNAAMPVLEAGIEEALAHLQYDLNNPGASGWTLGTISGQDVYSKQRTFADGSYFLVNIYNAGASNNPYIYSTGFVPSPLNSSSYISRTVRVTGTNAPLINLSFGTQGRIQMNGTGLAADSFDSSNPALSTSGRFDPSKTTTNGNVASVYGPVNFGNHNIAGNLYLGPDATTTVTSGQVSGEIYSDFNVVFPDVRLPDTTWLPAATTNIGGIATYDFKIAGDYYITGSSDIQVEAGVAVRLRVDATTFNPANIHILSTNGASGTLTIYQVAGSVTMSGNPTVDSGRARNFWYYGLPGVTSVTFGGTSSFIGVIYAPEANLTLNGGGNNNGLIGSSITKSITMNGHFDFHYDQDLSSIGPTHYVVNSWQEL